MFESLGIYKCAQGLGTAIVVFVDRWAAVVERSSGRVLSTFHWDTMADFAAQGAA